MKNTTTTPAKTEVQFLMEVRDELRAKGQWDNGTNDIGSVSSLCADIRECFGLECHTDGRFITMESTKIKNMKITIRHDQSSIDPSATYTEEQFAQVKESLEREYTKAIHAEYPDAEIEFEESTDTKSIVVKTSGLDDPSEIEDNIQRITETVFETGLFWL